MDFFVCVQELLSHLCSGSQLTKWQR